MKKISFALVGLLATTTLFAQSWSLTGNSGTTTSNFLGTTDGAPLIFKVDNMMAGFTGYSYNTNVSFGYRSMDPSVAGKHNTAIGTSTLYSNCGNYNTAIGSQALYGNVNGEFNTANGYFALCTNKNGSYNTANGISSLYYNVAGSYNAANGAYALYNNRADNNTANGYQSLYSNTTGSNNAATGYRAMYSNTTGNYNTAVGVEALYYNTTGYNNTAIGYYADVMSGDFNNATAIGYNAMATASNQVRIGNRSVTSIGGYVGWTIISDGRVKKNIREDVPGLDFINRLQPVTYNLNLDAIDNLMKVNKLKADGEDLETAADREAKEAQEKRIQTGFVAQDVEEIAKSIGYEFSGVDVDENGVYGLRYSEFVVPLVKAVQELNNKNNQLQAQNDRLQEQMNELTVLVYQLAGKDNATASSLGDDVVVPSLQQNVPNPFQQSSVIYYMLPQTFDSAQLVIVNTAGHVVRRMPVSGSGMGNIIIEGSSLQAGIYYYSLYVDNKLIDTKKMVLTK